MHIPSGVAPVKERSAGIEEAPKIRERNRGDRRPAPQGNGVHGEALDREAFVFPALSLGITRHRYSPSARASPVATWKSVVSPVITSRIAKGPLLSSSPESTTWSKYVSTTSRGSAPIEERSVVSSHGSICWSQQGGRTRRYGVQGERPSHRG